MKYGVIQGCVEFDLDCLWWNIVYDEILFKS